MVKCGVLILGGALLGAPAAVAQQGFDAAVFEQGQQLFETDCALCHKADGSGEPPAFPALTGNAQLGDLARVVSNIHRGQGDMPPFPELGAEEIAAVATYIRNAWGNEIGGVTVEQAAAALEGTEDAGAQASVWDGVYTVAQAERGLAVYGGVCSSCHGRRLDGAADDPDQRSSPPLARAKFLRNWNGRTVATLFEYTRATMPSSNPGFLSDQEYIDIVAHMLAASNIPEGDAELGVDPTGLARIVIEEQP